MTLYSKEVEKDSIYSLQKKKAKKKQTCIHKILEEFRNWKQQINWKLEKKPALKLEDCLKSV